MANHHIWKNSIFIWAIFLTNMNAEHRIADIICLHHVTISRMEEDVFNIMVNVLNAHI